MRENRRRRCGNVEIAGLAISKGRWERWKTAFWFSTVSTALAFPQRSGRSQPTQCAFLQRPSKASLAFCIRRAASVSVIRPASALSRCGVIPSFR